MAKKEPKEVVKAEPSWAVSPFEEMDRMFDNFFRRPFSPFGLSWFPRMRLPEFEEVSPTVDIFEDGDDVVVKTELPGMTKDDIEVSLSEDSITITGEKKKEEKIDKKDYYRIERSYGSFKRCFGLPAEVRNEKAKATFKNGVLEIRIPKTEEAKKKARKIKIE